MPKIPGGMADISTARRIAPPQVYNVRIESVELTQSSTKLPMFVTVTAILDETSDTGENVKGILMFENFTFQTKTGERNEAGLRAFKRVAEQTLGEEAANDEDFDSDALVGWQGLAQVDVESYVDKNDEEQQKNVVKRYINA